MQNGSIYGGILWDFLVAFWKTCQSYLLATIWWEINYAIDIIWGTTEEAQCDLVGLVQKMVWIQIHHP